jgi:hypothetical protein
MRVFQFLLAEPRDPCPDLRRPQAANRIRPEFRDNPLYVHFRLAYCRRLMRTIAFTAARAASTAAWSSLTLTLPLLPACTPAGWREHVTGPHQNRGKGLGGRCREADASPLANRTNINLRASIAH